MIKMWFIILEWLFTFGIMVYGIIEWKYIKFILIVLIFDICFKHLLSDLNDYKQKLIKEIEKTKND